MYEEHTTSGHRWRRLYCAHCGRWVDIPILCSDRFCFACSRVRAAKIRKRLRYILGSVPLKPGYFPAVITLSIPNSPDLAQQVKDLISSFRRLRQSRVWPEYVSGGATIIEIKKNPTGWHAHIHAFVMMRYFPWKKLNKAWGRASGGSQCYITKVSIKAALGYVTKYVTKTDLPPEDRAEASDCLKRYRLFQRFGAWHHVRIPRLMCDMLCRECGKSDWVFYIYDRHRVFSARGT